jgi:hypothetical protein
MRCPVCKADNVQGPLCRRCKTDLSLLFALEEQRRRALVEARDYLRRGQWPEAVQRAAEAVRLRGDRESRRLQATAQLLGRDFAAAWESYQSWHDSDSGED